MAKHSIRHEGGLFYIDTFGYAAPRDRGYPTKAEAEKVINSLKEEDRLFDRESKMFDI
jgi:hypothetical protein